jgi:DNA-binding GntR family transcriptional regulator
VGRAVARPVASGGLRSVGPLRDPPTKRAQVYDRIRDAILSGELPAGTRLSPTALAEQFGTSTMPVREAIRLLEDDGLVETSARRWSRVAMPGLELADDVYPIVGMLESFAVTSGEPPSPERLAQLRAANRDLRAAGREGNAIGCIDADTRFHSMIVQGANNKPLEEIIDELKARMRLLESAFFFHGDRVDTSAKQHDEIIRALAGGDLKAAAEGVQRNWEWGLQGVHEALARRG